MDTLTIDIDVTCSGQTTIGLVYTGLTVCYGDVVFPGLGWDDLVTPVLCWWADVVGEMLHKRRKSGRLLFMGGPYLVEVFELSDRRWEVCFVEGRRRRQVHAKFEADAERVAEALRGAIREVLSLCDERAWRSSEVGALRDALRQLTAE